MDTKISKRDFLTTMTLAAGAICAWEPLVSICQGQSDTSPAITPTPRRLNLNGGWLVSQEGKDDWFPATVPGNVFTDLMAAGRIPDPFCRDNEGNLQWVGKSNWVYRRTFDVTDDVLKNDRVLLRCEGLDTLATIKINGHKIGAANNMFRTWEFDVKDLLASGSNEIEILFDSPYPVMDKGESERAMYEWIGPHEPKGRAYVRKEPCSFGWDWGPCLPGCGIWKNISLETFNQGRIADVLILQNHSGKTVTLDIAVNAAIINDSGRPFRAILSVVDSSRPDKRLAFLEIPISGGKGAGQLVIKHPRLWWPAGMGEQALYNVSVDLLDPAGSPVDSVTRRIGLREMKMVLPQGDSPLHFEVNGVPFFARGANWIPCDSFANRAGPEILRRYVRDAAAVNMNALRFWGGGYYEDDALFDACDEAGICIWLDCKFACSSQPSFDDDFMDNVRVEIADNVRRLRHHPCIGVWCGNNEISLMTGDQWSDKSMGRADYDKLFKDLIAKGVAQWAPQATYVSGSPECGDTHYWEVWHGPKMFDAYRSLTGFMSEFGYQSFPEPKTVRVFTSEADRASVLTPVMKWHQRSSRGDTEGNGLMLEMMAHYFNAPKDFDMTLWLSQILQGYGIKIGAEYWRQTMPKSMGCVFWQYNDIWPGMSWSSVDYFGRWKALHYMARKFYSPILVSGIEHPEDGSADIFITNDLLEAKTGRLEWEVTDLNGTRLKHGSFKVEMPSRKSVKVETMHVGDEIAQFGASGVLLWLDLLVHGKSVSENLIFFALPKELKIGDPKLAWDVRKTSDGFEVSVASATPAFWTWLELENADASYSDNFFHCRLGEPRKILVQPKTDMDKDEFVKQLRVRSLYDCCVLG
ncbi:MAG TPA: glycoside hydrolase family 2 protein [Verrucomicrobiae bacterium]|nr:glycoside hydrolase family 2 protein [Verrucomicrobiae bacterium]